MSKVIAVILAGGAILATVPSTLAQVEGENAPTVRIIEWWVTRPNPPGALTPDSWMQLGPRSGGDPPVYSLARDGINTSNIQGSGGANEGAFLHEERDRVTVVLHIEDLDWQTEQGDQDQEVDEGVFVRVTAWPILGEFGPPPNAPPIAEMSDAFFGPTGSDEGFKPLFVGETFRDVSFPFSIPEFNGKNQNRLRGDIEWDVRYFLLVEVSNEQSPDEGGLGVTADAVQFVAIESPGLGPPNSPPFADAGPDRTVPAGFEVILDGSRTFDSFNVGFDPYDENVFEKDFLTFTWEWLTGPVRVEPVQVDSSLPDAVVTLDLPGVYQYRLIVDDNVRGLPSTDSVQITVVASLPGKNPPRAVIVGPASAVVVGQVITLDGESETVDPDGDELRFRWLQTNELGGQLTFEELQQAFLALGGVDEGVSTWQAIAPGTFYFRLLVDDGDFRSSATFSVEVVEAGEAGAAGTTGNGSSGTGDSGTPGTDADDQAPSSSALCGAGVLPLAVVPLALCVMRRRIR